MNEIISKQRLAAALKKYKAENSIPNIYFFINNYRNKYPYNFNFIKICGKEYELKYVTIVSNSNYISELIGRKNLYTDDVYVISIESVSTCNEMSPITYKPKICYIVSCTFLRVVA